MRWVVLALSIAVVIVWDTTQNDSLYVNKAFAFVSHTLSRLF